MPINNYILYWSPVCISCEKPLTTDATDFFFESSAQSFAQRVHATNLLTKSDNKSNLLK